MSRTKEGNSAILTANGLLVEKEMTELIIKIVAVVNKSAEDIYKERLKLRRQPETLEQLARLTELKIRAIEIAEVNKQILAILKTSTNRLILASIQIEPN